MIKNKSIKENGQISTGMKKAYHAYAVGVMTISLIFLLCVTAFATGAPAAGSGSTDPIAVVNNLSDFIFGLIRAVGLIMLGFGVVQLGLSLKSHDPSQRANGLLTLAGGIVIAFAKEIMQLIIK